MNIDFTNVDLTGLDSYKDKSLDAFKTLIEKTGEGSDFLGWIDRPVDLDMQEYERIKKASKKIQTNSDVLVTIGIGGSYLGTKAIDYAMAGYFRRENGTQLVYAGHQLSGEYLYDLLDFLKEKEFSVNVISKSGTTTEPAIAFRFLKEMAEEKYGKEEAKNRIFVTTDRQKGALKDLATKEGYETFVVPDDIGGRFSVISAVGLLPLCVAGVDIDKFVDGFKNGRKKYTINSFEENDAIKYAAIRNMLYENGKDIEVLVNYEPKLKYISEWWKQLFAESEGKDGKGLFPVSVNNTTDLHSLGQMIQDGKRNIFETVLKVQKPDKDITIKEDSDNLDGLNYLAGRDLSYVNEKAMEGTILAHIKGNVPNILLTIDDVSEESLGELLYFFEVVVGVSGYMLGVNPFNQPGVEEYKTQMFKLLGKPGY
ncbi:glucose-6-phosphate isomerase [Anaerococcus sp. AGMB00486]|uniref:Glucose-6-phosphate isomerase n=2 Tax=Anaerococcus TaxID=165779 RepID=A0ABX2N8S6_9FIRM|nr:MULTISPECIES: glucose-6-phosphate isomerase [Anaerococcus]MDY3005665.1 glucose-6-phosphate isomerase [Anaerococcus porci]MSS77443.1 glucose-6-phosphate isomerase [Anaerococcus porci]NVF11102.1 glucose-6-phosphate isomerase [Anaerococcus faecalis]